MLECFWLGFLLMSAYRVLKLIRKIIKHSIILISIEDIIYWMCSGILMFLLLYKEDAGTVRWFAVALVLIGMIIYREVVEKIFEPFFINSIKGLLPKKKKHDNI